MPAALLDLLTARYGEPSERGNVDWLTALDDCLHAPEIGPLLRRLPSRERRALLAAAGRTVYRQDVGNYAAELRYNTRSLIASGQMPGLPAQLEEHAACLFAAASDALDFETRASAEAHLRETRVAVGGLERLRPFLRQRGIVLLSVFQSHFGYAVPLLEGPLGPVALVRKPQDGEDPGVAARALLDWCEAVEVVPADARGGMRLLQVLRHGGIVGLYNDFLYPDARAARGFLFGDWVPVSRTLLMLIRKTGAVVVPVSIARALPAEGDEVEVRFHSPLPSTLVPGEATEAALALELSLATECLIRRHPAQWRLWNTLRLRWEWGRGLS